MLTRLHIENLKCFTALSLPLAPLTLLTGFNAAGKSTALQALLLLAQRVRLGITSSHLPLNGFLVRLGTPGEVLNETLDKTELELGIEMENLSVAWRLRTEDRAKGNALRIEGIRIKPQGIETPRHPDIWTPDDLLPTLRNTIFLSAIRTGSFDTFPSPDMVEPIHADVGVQGEYAPWWLERCGDDAIEPVRHHPGESAPTLRRQLNAWAGALFPGAEANAQAIGKTTLVQFELRNRITDPWRRPANIGYGLTYAFPILVAALLAKPGQILVIDSPEAHLHPKAQSSMGYFLARMAAAGVQVMIETHSDHVLNGVRLAVRDQKIEPDHVALHFFNPRPQTPTDPAQVVSPLVDRLGNLSEWPEGFFDQAEKDLARLAGWN